MNFSSTDNFFIIKIQNFINQVSQNQKIIKGIPQQQQVIWIKEQLDIIANYLEQLSQEQQQIIPNETKLQLNQIENLLLQSKYQLNQQLNAFESPINLLEKQQKRNERPPLQKILQRQKGNIITIEEPSSIELADKTDFTSHPYFQNDSYKSRLKEKEQKIDENFQKIMERYNRSKQLVEQTQQHSNFNEIRKNKTYSKSKLLQGQQQYYPLVQSEKKFSHQEIDALKQDIIEKMKKAEFNQYKNDGKQNYSLQQESPIRHCSVNTINNQIRDLNITQSPHKKFSNTISPQAAINTSIQYKQQVTIEELKLKQNQLQKQVEILKENLQETYNTVEIKQREIQELKVNLVQKEDQLLSFRVNQDQYGKECANLSDALIKCKDQIYSHEREYERTLSKHDQQVQQLQLQLQNAEETLTKNSYELAQQQANIQQEVKIRQDIQQKYQQLNQEKLENENNLNQVREQYEGIIKQQEKKIKQLQDFVEENSIKYGKIQNQHDVQQAKFEEYRDQIKNLEQKLAKKKLSFQKEISAIKECQVQEISDYKSKIKQLKNQNNSFSEQIIALKNNENYLKTQQNISIEEKNKFILQLKEIQEQKQQLEKQCNDYKQSSEKLEEEKQINLKQLDQQYQNVSFIYNTIKNYIKLSLLQSDIEKKQRAIDRLEFQLQAASKIQSDSTKELEEMKLKQIQWEDERIRIYDQNSYLEMELQKIKYRQSSEIEEIRMNFQALLKEVEELRIENIKLKEQEKGLRSNIKQAEQQQYQFKEKSEQMKMENQLLSQNLNEFEQKVNTLIQDKQYETNQLAQKKDMHQKQLQQKLKVLDNIQNMIKSHKIKNISHQNISNFI